MGLSSRVCPRPWQLLFKSPPVLISSNSQGGGDSFLCRMDEYCCSSYPTGTVGVQLPGLQEYGAVGGSTHAASSAMWACQHCTFMNQPGTGHCEMCSLPRT